MGLIKSLLIDPMSFSSKSRVFLRMMLICRWVSYVFGGFGTILFVASILCFIAWYVQYSKTSLMTGNRSENPLLQYPTWLWLLSSWSSSLYKLSLYVFNIMGGDILIVRTPGRTFRLVEPWLLSLACCLPTSTSFGTEDR